MEYAIAAVRDRQVKAGRCHRAAQSEGRLNSTLLSFALPGSTAQWVGGEFKDRFPAPCRYFPGLSGRFQHAAAVNRDARPEANGPRASRTIAVDHPFGRVCRAILGQAVKK